MARMQKLTPSRSRNGAYDERVLRLIKTIAIAEEVTKKARGIPATDKKALLAWDNQVRELALSPASPKLKTIKSLELLERDFLGYWNEAAGSHVEKFWARLAENGIDFERHDVVREVLDRQRIKSVHEYEVIVDSIVVYEQLGKLTRAEVAALNKMVGDYETRKSKRP